MQYWDSQGPALLAAGWEEAYPHMPLEKLQDSVQSLDFLSGAMEDMETSTAPGNPVGGHSHIAPDSTAVTAGGVVENGECLSGDIQCLENGIVGGNCLKETEICCSLNSSDSPAKVDVICGEMAVSGVQKGLEQLVVSEDSVAGVRENGAGTGEDMEKGVAGSDPLPNAAELMELWNAYYNSYYWYMYHNFCQQTQEVVLCQQTQEVVLYQAEPGAQEQFMDEGVVKEEPIGEEPLGVGGSNNDMESAERCKSVGEACMVENSGNNGDSKMCQDGVVLSECNGGSEMLIGSELPREELTGSVGCDGELKEMAGEVCDSQRGQDEEDVPSSMDVAILGNGCNGDLEGVCCSEDAQVDNDSISEEKVDPLQMQWQENEEEAR